MTPTVCLTLLVPVHAEDRVIDFLLAHDDTGIEFSMHNVAARGPLVRMAANDERVRGFATRVEVKLILDSATCERLIPALSDLLAGVHGGYWVTSVHAFAPFPALVKAAGACA
jgi:hypothetical protein